MYRLFLRDQSFFLPPKGWGGGFLREHMARRGRGGGGGGKESFVAKRV